MIATTALRKAMHEIAAKKGDFTLFALFLRADALGTWDLVVSAPWLQTGTLKVIGELAELLGKSMGAKSLHQFSRIAPVSGEHPAVKFILANLPVENGELRLRNTDLFGLQIEEAIIFRAKRPEPEWPRPSKGRRRRRTRRPVGHRAAAAE